MRQKARPWARWKWRAKFGDDKMPTAMEARASRAAARFPVPFCVKGLHRSPGDRSRRRNPRLATDAYRYVLGWSRRGSRCYGGAYHHHGPRSLDVGP